MLSGNYWLKGLVAGFAPSSGDGTEVAARFSRESDMMVAMDAGAYAEPCSRGQVFAFGQAAFTMPVNASNLVSKFTISNPANSGKLLELIDADISTILATTVVDAVGLYGLINPILGTLTAAIPVCGIVGGGAAPVALCYSAATFVGTPLLCALLGGWGAVTDGSLNNVHYDFKGKIIVPPGSAVALAMTTAASTASGITAMMSWRERPL